MNEMYCCCGTECCSVVLWKLLGLRKLVSFSVMLSTKCVSEQTAIISLYSINWLVCITETECVYCAVRTGYLYIMFFSQHSNFPLSVSFHHCSIFIHLQPTLYSVFLPVLQFSPVSIIPPLLHTHSFIYHPHCIMFFSQYFRFPLSVSFHHFFIHTHSFITHVLLISLLMFLVFLPFIPCSVSLTFILSVFKTIYRLYVMWNGGHVQ